MKLHEYLSSPGALSVADLRAAIGAKSDAQISQWRHGYVNRIPSPKNAWAIERATKGAVTRRDLRPDWRDIWPDLAEPVAAA